ncbi:MAG: WG repeat-containing protein [Chitinophagaceae bacterium]
MRMISSLFCRSFFLLSCIMACCSTYGQTALQKKLELIRLRLEKQYSILYDFDTTAFVTVYASNNIYGYIDTSGNIVKLQVNEDIYTTSAFLNGFAFIGTLLNKQHNYYIIDNKGNVIHKLEDVEDIRDWSNIDRIIVKHRNGKYGVINRKGQVVIPFEYYLLESIGDNLYKAYRGEAFSHKTGVVNSRNEVIVPFIYDELYYYNPLTNYLLVCQGKDLVASRGKQKYIAKDAFLFYSPQSSGIHIDYVGGMILNKTQRVDILYNLQLDTIRAVTQKFDNIEFISEGLIGVRNWFNKEFDEQGNFKKATGSEFMLINREGKIVTDKKYNNGEQFKEGMSQVTEVKDNRGYYGFIDRKGELKIPCVYKKASSFRNGYAKVQQGDRYFVIDKTGNFVMGIKSF